MEALAAIGLAGNVVQFVQFGCELLSTALTIVNSVDGLTASHSDLSSIADHLQLHNESLSQTTTADDALQGLVNRSISVTAELLEAIEDIRLRKKKSPLQRLRNFREALSAVWKQKRIENLLTRFERVRDEISFHLLAETRGIQTRLCDALSTMSQKELQRCRDTDKQIRDMDRVLNSISQKLSDGKSDISLQKMQLVFSEFRRGFERSMQLRLILRSLQYERMTVRSSQIREAHKRTFQWIFSENASSLPENRPESGFSTWLQEGSGIYWITGKPGSGKSTLMKFIEGHARTAALLDQWAQSSRIVTASFYFWNAGTSMQKSLQGLLQSLLFSMLSNCPEVIPDICSKRWNDGRRSTLTESPWSISELQRSIEDMKSQSRLSVKFYFHIDGLDEFEGDDHSEIIKILQDLSESPAVKLCVSSRPWNCFKDTIGKCNGGSIKLHEWTAKDIERFAEDNIVTHIQPANGKGKGDHYAQLIREIRDRAEGVFLWVRLAVHSLRAGIANDDQVFLLKQRLREIPTDLEEFFQQILESVDPVYRRRMAYTFSTALKLDQPWTMIHYSFLDELEENPCFGLQLPFECMSAAEIEKRVEETQYRLNGRYRGLLEPCSTQVEFDTPVDFLHRTLRDFLETEKMRHILNSRLPSNFSVTSAIVNTLLADIKFAKTSPRHTLTGKVLKLIRKASQEKGDTSFEFSILDHIEMIYGQDLSSSALSDPTSCQLMLEVALHVGRNDYIFHRIQQGTAKKLDNILVHSTFCPSITVCSMDKEFIVNGYTYQSDMLSPSEPFGSLTYCRLSSDDKYNFSKDRSHIEFVRTLLDYATRPTTLLGDLPMWTEIAKHLLLYLDDANYYNKWQRLAKVLMSHGADFERYHENWKLVFRGAYHLPYPQVLYLMKGFSLLFDLGLNPFAKSAEGNLWSSLLKLRTKGTYEAGYDLAMTRLLHSLMRHPTVQTRLNTRASFKEIEFSWIGTIMEGIQRSFTVLGGLSPVHVFKILLDNGFDANASLAPPSLWERTLAAFDLGLRIWNVLDNSRIEMCLDVLLLFLQRGANPKLAALHTIMHWLSDLRSPMTDRALELAHSVLYEIEQRTGKTYHLRFERLQLLQTKLSSPNPLAASLKRPAFLAGLDDSADATEDEWILMRVPRSKVKDIEAIIYPPSNCNSQSDSYKKRKYEIRSKQATSSATSSTKTVSDNNDSTLTWKKIKEVV